MVLLPTITREQAAEILGAPMPEAAWGRVERAFEAYGEGLDALQSTKANNNKNDPDGWRALKDAVCKDLEKVLELLGRTKDRRRFLHEATELYELQTRNISANYSISDRLDRAYSDVLHSLTVAERAQPERIKVASRSELDRELARRLRDVLAEHGLPCAVSDGRSLPDDAAEADMKPFERFLSALGFHESAPPSAFSRWAREAVSGKN